MDPVKRLSDFKKLLELDIITQDEFNDEKEKLMKMMGNEETKNNQAMIKQSEEIRKPNFGWAILGFCIPIVGLILFIVWLDTRPGESKYSGVGALVGFIFAIIVWVIISIA
ncbi:MAG: DUF805 domain-containing protein [Eubacterium sp.]|nr:DUF805 domain-containing protein [Eubacterium sp.]MCH4046341.1 DUF805 domain-containing protein [Eubacterium sp.]MCH4079436.1 DUF805 domain-containing protein [Eubacterium sp.]MCH4111014.1 DUF805 domain-containing protein [Eubacterium sp.]MCI1307162.1 DUF805 domain-containing protein [Eubacterium sp.]